MKKIFLIIYIMMLSLVFNNVYAKEKVKFSKCVDGDTIKVTIDNEEKTVRFLAIDTPESVHPSKGIEYYGKEASNYTCDKVTNAKKIELEYDSNSDKEDKYNRILAWVFVDGSLLQDDLVSNGYAEVAYLYGDYKYTSLLQDHQAVAESKKIGIWNEEEREKYNIDNNITDDIEDVDENYSDSDIETVFQDTVQKIKDLDIDYNHITFKDIRNIIIIILTAIGAIIVGKITKK